MGVTKQLRTTGLHLAGIDDLEMSSAKTYWKIPKKRLKTMFFFPVHDIKGRQKNPAKKYHLKIIFRGKPWVFHICL